jgi:steroid 5-alpha reductase family enzyme
MMAEAWALAFPPRFWVLPIVAAVCCSMGFRKFVWFLSVGYGFAVAGLGATLLVMFLPDFAPSGLVVYLEALLLLVYGLRLGGYLLKRERRSTAYRKTLSESGSDKRFPLGASLGVWVAVTILFCLQVSPVFFRLANGTGAQATSYVGLAVSLLGFALEALADHQKTAAKRERPGRFCDVGLFRVVRCPSYLGEAVLWTGVFVSGIGAYEGLFQWLLACLGYALILFVMVSSTRRLEGLQAKRYGNDPEFKAYAARTPVLLPFVPPRAPKKARNGRGV